MQVDRYRRQGARDGSHEYLLLAYGDSFPGVVEAADYVPVGASDTRSLPESLCNEIERVIGAQGYWLGDLPTGSKGD